MSGLWLSLGSCGLYAFWAILNKVASRTLTAHEAQLYLNLTSLIVVLFSAVAGGDKLRFTSVPATGVVAAVGAGISGAAAGIMYIRALATGSTAMATAVSGLYPAVACVIAVGLMGEPVQANQVLGVLLAVASGIAFASG